MRTSDLFAAMLCASLAMLFFLDGSLELTGIWASAGLIIIMR